MPEQQLLPMPSLYGGISKQPPHLRHMSQVQDAQNMSFSPAYGAYKRPGTKFVAYLGNARITISSVTGTFSAGQAFTQTSPSAAGTVIAVSSTGAWLTLYVTSGTMTSTGTIATATGSATVNVVQCQYGASANLRMHPIYRDKSETYLLVQSDGKVPRVFPLVGPEAEVSFLAAMSTYMASGSPTAQDYRYLSIIDYTLIANTKIAIAGTAGNGSSTHGTITATTMPVSLKRTSISPPQFTVAVETWPDESFNGDVISPIFTGGKKLSDIALHRNRMVLAANDLLVFSQAGDYFNFWNANSGVGDDADPVGLNLPGPSVVFIDRVVAFRNTLVVFSIAGRQFEVSAPDIFGPGAVSVHPTTSYDTISIVPSQFGTSILFASKIRETGAIYQYVYDDIQVSSTALPMTGHVEGLIGANVTRVVSHTNSGFVAVLTSDDPTQLTVYQESYEGTKRVQTAWSVWTFPGVTRICDVAMVNGVLFVLGETAVGYTLEGVAVGTTLTADTGTIAPSGGTSSVVGDVGSVLPDA